MAKKKVGQERLDKYYHRAKEMGYNSRAAFKLLQIHEKLGIFRNTKVVVDLCAAPGGWLQVASRTLPPETTIIGIDLDPIQRIAGATTLVEDITTASCHEKLQSLLGEQKADLVLHDGAPNVGASWAQDAYNQNELVLHSLRLACDFLAPKGTFVTKVFRSKDFEKLKWVFKQFFASTHEIKPDASREASAEIFVVCKEYLFPKEIDPDFFSPEKIFQDIAVSKKKKKSARDGYDTEKLIIYEECTANDFIMKETSALLEDYNRIAFPADTSPDIVGSRHTTGEIRELCNDLKLLGKGDLNKLRRWRQRVQGEIKKKEPLPAAEEEKEATLENEIKRSERIAKRKVERRLAKIARRLYGDSLECHEDMESTEENISLCRGAVHDAQSRRRQLMQLEDELEETTDEEKHDSEKRASYETPALVEGASALLSRHETESPSSTKRLFNPRPARREETDSSSLSEDELSDRELAIGARLMTEKGRRELVEQTIGRKHFADIENAPRWFLDEMEAKIDAGGADAREVIEEKKRKINKKVRKKEIEALHRNKKKYESKLKSIKEKMNHVLEDDEEGRKTEKIGRLERELKTRSKRKKNFVFVTKSGAKNGRSQKGKNVFVDSRMKKDLRREKRKSRKNKKR
uniref:rRNA methyltransferase Spb1 n=1 Tax=Metchnikovella dogieli TaxID=2804710 RepID=A0A896WDH3_9MICR|nr:rRNA methyltransferase Spb1 [Metchnikovella dogieli]